MIENVIKKAEIVAKEIGIELGDKKKLYKRVKEGTNIPIIINSNGYQLWIDRRYIAYSSNDEILVHYVHATYDHAKEEVKAIQRRNFKKMSNTRSQNSNRSQNTNVSKSSRRSKSTELMLQNIEEQLEEVIKTRVKYKKAKKVKAKKVKAKKVKDVN